MSILVLNHISKSFGKGDSQVDALRDIRFSVEEGEYVAIMGESGAGTGNSVSDERNSNVCRRSGGRILYTDRSRTSEAFC